MLSSTLFIAVAVISFDALTISNAFSFCSRTPTLLKSLKVPETRLYGARNRAWAKGDLSDKDIFEGTDDESSGKQKKMKLEPETVFFEGPPSAAEVILPAISIFTVIGLVPFASAVSRQFWVRYKFTSRRVAIQSGFQGKDQAEIIYPDIEEVRFVYRNFGKAGDMVLFLKDGAKVELRHVPNFENIYTFIMSKCDAECQAKSMKLTPQKNPAPAN